jgi:hypothetical protein
MLSTVASRLTIIAALASPFCGAQAARPELEAKVVARLYQDYAWQAIATQPDLFGDGLAGASKTKLENYFAPKLANLLVEDSACAIKNHEICKLDFDLLFDSQDPRVTDLTVERLAPGRVQVQFNDPVTDKKTLIEFRLALVSGKWRIIDILYGKHPQESLTSVLSRPLPED